MKAEVAERAIVRRVTIKDTTATDVRCVHAIIVRLTATIKAKEATSLAKVFSPEKEVISPVHATIAKEATNLVKADIVQDTIAKADISQEKEATNLAKVLSGREKEAIVLAIIATEKEVISLAKVVTISVHAPQATILMLSTASKSR